MLGVYSLKLLLREVPLGGWLLRKSNGGAQEAK